MSGQTHIMIWRCWFHVGFPQVAPIAYQISFSIRSPRQCVRIQTFQTPVFHQAIHASLAHVTTSSVSQTGQIYGAEYHSYLDQCTIKGPRIDFETFHHAWNFGFLTPEDGTDRFSRKVGKKLPLLASLCNKPEECSPHMPHYWFVFSFFIWAKLAGRHGP